jgi:hypothetical protein
MSLTYVSILTDEGMLKVPNSSLLAAAVGPWDRMTHHQSEQHREESSLVGAGRGTGVPGRIR